MFLIGNKLRKFWANEIWNNFHEKRSNWWIFHNCLLYCKFFARRTFFRFMKLFYSVLNFLILLKFPQKRRDFNLGNFANFYNLQKLGKFLHPLFAWQIEVGDLSKKISVSYMRQLKLENQERSELLLQSINFYWNQAFSRTCGA